MITQKRLKELLNYDPETGFFTRKISLKGRTHKGDHAGSSRGNGYIAIGIDGKKYYAHRLAWLYVYGYFPEQQIDHINRNRTDNRICNLREASQQCNARNARTKSVNRSGVVGVCWVEKQNRWRASITVSNASLFLGHFTDKTSAVRARWEAEKNYGFPTCNTTSTSYKYLKQKGLS